MCGRYNILPDERAWANAAVHLGQVVSHALSASPARYNIAPTQLVPIVISGDGGEPVVREARWGFIPHYWNQPKMPTWTTNARSETAGTSNMWRSAYRNARCLIPASGWYEWLSVQGNRAKPEKYPHLIRLNSGEQIMFAGLWSWHEGLGVASCAILTAGAQQDLAEIHERTPIVLEPSAWREWINPAMTDRALIAQMLAERSLHHLSLTPVGRYVSNARNQGEECIAPSDEAGLKDFGRIRYSNEKLEWLHVTPPSDLIEQLAMRLKAEATAGSSAAPAASRAEVHLWVREVLDRDDADQFSGFVSLCREWLRSRR